MTLVKVYLSAGAGERVSIQPLERCRERHDYKCKVHPMKFLSFIQQTAARLFYLALGISLASGFTNAVLVGLISQQITGRNVMSDWFIGSFALLIIGAVLLDLGAKHTLNLLLHRITYELRLSFASQVLDAPLARLETVTSPRLFAMIIEDVTLITQVLVELPTVVIGLATLAGCLLYLLWLAPFTLLSIIGLALPILVGYWVLQRRLSRVLQWSLTLRNQLLAAVHDLADGIKELKLHLPRRAAFYHLHLQSIIAQSTQSSIRYCQYYFLAQNINQFTYFIILLGLFILSRRFSIPGEVLGVYAIMILYLKNATTTLVSALPRATEALTVIKQLEELGFTLRAPIAVPQLTHSLSTPINAITLDLHELTYAYDDRSDESSFHVGPLTCRLQAGEIVFMIGGNGSGKTTFLKLLVGLYTPTAGQLIWNGTPVTPDNLETYQQNFAVIFAEPYLFTHLLGQEGSQLDQRAQVWLQRLHLERKVQVVDGKFSTLNLSFGQRKRLALLTAYLEERPVYVFDEWAAGQDPEFRELFYRTLLPDLKAQGKLVIVISHDDHYFDAADRIIKLDAGQIAFDRLSTAPSDRGAMAYSTNGSKLR